VSREVIPVWIEPKPDREYFDYTGVAWCFSVFGPKGLCFSGYLKSHIIGILISSPIARREAFTILSYFAFWYNWNSPGLTKHAVIRTAVALTGQEFRSSPKNQSNCQVRSRVQLSTASARHSHSTWSTEAFPTHAGNKGCEVREASRQTENAVIADFAVPLSPPCRIGSKGAKDWWHQCLYFVIANCIDLYCVVSTLSYILNSCIPA